MPSTASSSLADAPRLELRGTPVVRLVGRELELRPVDAALLAYLALEGPTERGRLAALFWPESSVEAARNSLRQRLFALRRQVGTELVTGSRIAKLADGVRHDLDAESPLLAGVEMLAGAEVDAWIDAARRTRAGARRARHLAQADAAEAAGDWNAARAVAETLLAEEPLSEAAHRRLMRAHYAAGDRAAALLAFDRCERMLKDEVGTRPASETLALLQTIESAAASPTPSPATLPASVLRPPRIVGRAAELAAAANAWGAGHVLALVGEGGLGKSRILQEFAAARPGVVRVAARPGDADVPLATLARLLRELVARPSVTAPSVPSERRALARVLPELDPEASFIDDAPEGRRIGLLLGLRRFIAGCAGVEGIVVDDLHFADASSIELLTSLVGDREEGHAESVPRWAFAWRPVEAASPVLALQHRLEEAARLASVPVAPLDLAALAELVDTLGLPGVSGARLAPSLLRRTGGNPLFVLETLKQAWVERALDGLAGGAVAARPISAARLIERRLAQLSPGALALARVAGIAGVDFGIGLAEHVLGATALQFADALAELERAQVLQDDAFAHDLVFEAVVAGVPAAIARHAHAQIAAWLAAHGGEPARVARHWIDGGRPEHALEWLQRAADAAARTHRVREQLAFLETKSGIERDLGQASAAFSTLLAAMEIAGNYEMHAELGETLFGRLEALASSEADRVAVASLRAELHLQRGEPAAAIEVATPALRASHLLGQTAMTMTLRATLGTAEMMLGRSAAAQQHLEVCVVWFDEHGGGSERATLHGNLGVLYDNLGRLDDAHAHFRLAETQAHAASDFANLGPIAVNLGRNRLLAGDLEAAERHLQRAEQLALAHDAAGSHLAALRLMRVNALSLRGRYGEALRQAELAFEAAERQQPGLLDQARIRLGHCWASLGQWTRLRQSIAEVDVDRAGSPVVRIGRARLQAWYAEATGDAVVREQARALLRAEHAALAGDSRPDLRLPLEIELAEDEPAEIALARLDAVRREAERYGHRPVVLGARLRAAAAALRHGDVRRAVVEARAALALHDDGVPNSAVMPAELWWRSAEALTAAGERAEAARIAAEGAARLQRIAEEEVPDSFRRSFLEREPANRALISLAARLAVAPAPAERRSTRRRRQDASSR